MNRFASSHMRSIFGDLAHEERERISQDNNMCPFCLRHGADQDYIGQDMDMRPVCPVPKCIGKHAKWLHKLMTKGLT